ncbi:MAG: 16S rRNA (guanine(527)-N(7))-methyltransferase RsmG [Gammaproteobacteria bacterium]|nr:16S rRNA (guanine(527)-N(7))-methyltransferase RsmG [Gammaproteobacteria bacterium]
MISNHLQNFFTEGLTAQGVSYTQEQIDACFSYVELLQKWNKVFNLTSIIDTKEIIQLHLLDSLSIVPQLIKDCEFEQHNIQVADVGTGAGLPGIPLSIFFPENYFTLIDARDKKIKFLNQVKATLNLHNIQPLHARVETIHPEITFDLVVTRAFSSMKDMLEITQHLCHTNGLFLAMKGRLPNENLAEIPTNIKWLKTEEVSVYELDANRCTVLFRKL